MESIKTLLMKDEHRMEILRVVASLDLPDWYIAAGFVRNLVWDYLHGYAFTVLNDVDVIYFDACRTHELCEIEKQLANQASHVNWQVKNQALMHLRNQDPPYCDSTDAMRYWPEKETAVGVRLSVDGKFELAAPFGTASLWAGELTHNPNRDRNIFEQRVASKNWLRQWPKLRVK